MFGEPKRICPIFQRLLENDVWEFESSQPSHGVGSNQDDFWACVVELALVSGNVSDDHGIRRRIKLVTCRVNGRRGTVAS